MTSSIIKHPEIPSHAVRFAIGHQSFSAVVSRMGLHPRLVRCFFLRIRGSVVAAAVLPESNNSDNQESAAPTNHTGNYWTPAWSGSCMVSAELGIKTSTVGGGSASRCLGKTRSNLSESLRLYKPKSRVEKIYGAEIPP